VRLVLDNEAQPPSCWQAIVSIASTIDCSPQTLNEWVKKAEVDSGQRPGIPTVVLYDPWYTQVTGESRNWVCQTRAALERLAEFIRRLCK
jgi:transposase-like protein